MSDLPSLLEAILFYQAEPLSIHRLSGLVKRQEDEVRTALEALEHRLSQSGLRLIRLHDSVTLGTTPEASAVIEAITKEELSKDLSKASLETLSIILYKGPITRAEIDYIRGVNSTFILRNLLVRGLIEKVDNPDDARSFLYRPTFQILEFMGITSVTELPDYEQTMTSLAHFVTEKEQKEEAASPAEIAPTPDPDPQDADADQDAQVGILEDDEAEASMQDEDGDVLADIAEEDIAVGGFDDAQLDEHLRSDEAQQL